MSSIEKVRYRHDIDLVSGVERIPNLWLCSEKVFEKMASPRF